jgi:hypothetical protein
MTEFDFACLDWIVSANSQLKRSEAVRLSLLRQVECDRLEDDIGSLGLLVRDRPNGESSRKFSQRLRTEDFTAIDTIRDTYGLKSRASAMRLAVRAQARRDGMVFPEIL